MLEFIKRLLNYTKYIISSQNGFALITKPTTFVDNTTAIASEVNNDFDTIYNEFNGNITDANISGAANIDESKIGFTGTKVVRLTSDQTVAGIKTFSSFPITPSSLPTTDYQVANKLYVDSLKTTLAQAIGSTDISTNSVAYVDMTDMSIATFSDAGVYLAMFTASIFPPDGNGAQVWVTIDIDGTDYAPARGTGCNSADAYRQEFPVSTWTVQTLGAGAHTFKVQWKVASGTATQTGTSAQRTLVVLKIG